MEFAASYHTGTRKDGVTKEFEHQISQAMLARTLIAYLVYPEDTFCVVQLHDVQEDYNVSRDEITQLFGQRIADATWKMTKVYREQKKSEELYFAELATCPIASVCKGLDRIHNQSSMNDVFTVKKQEEYVDETEQHILPMLKKARRSFPEQEPVYENLKFILVQQNELHRSIIDLKKSQTN